MTSYDIIVEHLRKQHNLPDGWAAYMFEHLHNDPIPGQPVEMKVFGTKFTGAVPGRYVRGPKKGQPNWKKMDKSTVLSFFLSPECINDIYAQWEKDTKICHHCCGEGKKVYRWSKDEGNHYRFCKDCNGTGEAKE